MYLNTYFT